MGSIGNNKTTPPTIPTDEVIPMFKWDDQPHNREMVVEFTYRFDSVLDNDKLKHSLERLLEIGDWKKVGSRIRLNSNGKLDYHVPEKYDELRPGFLWAHENFTQPIGDHPLASQLPQAKSEPTIFGDPAQFHSLTAHPNHPTCLDDFVYNDQPPLSIKLITFSNASLLTLSWSHTFLDAVGRQTLLKAWILVLNKREQDLPEFIGYRDDPEETLGSTTSPEKHVLYPVLVPSSDLGLLVNSLIQEGTQYPVESARIIQIPNSFVQNLKREAYSYLSETNGQDPSLFLSDADILFAWLSRLNFASQASTYSPTRLISLLNVFNYRGIVPNLPLEKAYIGNAVSAAQTHITVSQLISQHFALTALQIRTDLLKQTTAEQVEATVSLARTLGHGPFFGSPDQIVAAWSNWHRCRFYEMDFSAAVKDGKGGRPTYLTNSGHAGKFNTRNTGALLGKDAEDNWWVSWTLRDAAWEGFEKGFYELTRGGGKK